MRIENTNLKLLDNSFRKDVNLIKVGANNTYAHELAKCKVCIYLKKNKRDFVCEAIFNNNKGRADIFDLNYSVCYEVVMSEKKESIKVKKGKYPVDLVELNAQEILDCEEKDLYKYLN